MELGPESDYQGKIDAYVRGELSPEEQVKFEASMQIDQELSEAVQDARLNRLAIRHYGLRKDLKALHTQAMADIQPVDRYPEGAQLAKASTRPVRPLWAYAGRVAAGLVLLLLTFTGYQLATVTGEKLSEAAVRQRYQPETMRGAEEDGHATEEQLKDAYQRGDYQTCVRVYQIGQLAARSGSQEARLLAGNAYLALNQPARAETCFRQVLSINARAEEPLFQEDAEYYLALALLEENKVAEADKRFTQIRQNPNHGYHHDVNWWFYQRVQWLKWRHG